MADDTGRQERDEELGAAIRQLHVPPPGEGFYTTLLARLEAEEAAMRPSAVRARRRWFSPAGLSAVAAVVAVVVIISWLGLPGGHRSGVLGPGRAEAITLEEMQEIVTDTLTSARTVQGEVIIEQGGARGPSFGPPETRFSFALTSQGDHRMTALTGTSDHSYDAQDGLQRIVVPGFGGSAPSVSESRGLSAGPPDPSPDRSLLARSLGSLVRTFLGVRADVPVLETELEGRPVWRAVIPVGADRTLEVAVDRETGFPLETIERDTRFQAVSDTVPFQHVRVSNLVVDQPIGRERFRLDFPPGVPTPSPIDLGFRRVALDDIQRQVGYRPLVPREVPEGFTLVEVATARQSAGTGRNNPISQNVVSMAYQRGFDRIVVSTRSTGSDPGRWSDPLADLDPGEPQPVRLHSGDLRGATAVVVLDREGHHLWAVTPGHVLTIAGDATPEQLLAMANSLAARG